MTRLAQFPTGPTLVITIGELGAQMLFALERYMDNCNVLFDYQQLDMLNLTANYPRFFHIELEDADTYVEDVSLLKPTVTRIRPHHGAINSDDWEDVDGSNAWSWLQTLGTLEAISARAAARLGLQAALQHGQADPLTTALKNLLTRSLFRSILIVASCDEPLGTQIIGDLAALIRFAWPHQAALPIYALIHGQNRDVKTTVSAIEIGSLSSYSRLSWGLPTGEGWNLTNEESRLVDGAFCFLSTAPKASLASFLWSYLTSEVNDNQSLSAQLGRDAGSAQNNNMHIPAITCVDIRSHETPLRFLRDMVAYRAMSLLIDATKIAPFDRAGHDLTTVRGLNHALEQWRPQGISAWIAGYGEITRANLEPLIAHLRAIKVDFDNRLTACVADFQQVLDQEDIHTQFSLSCRYWNLDLVNTLAQLVRIHLLEIVGLSLTERSTAGYWNGSSSPAIYLDFANRDQRQYHVFKEIVVNDTLSLARRVCNQFINENYNPESRLNEEFRTREFQDVWQRGFQELTSHVVSLTLQRPGQAAYPHHWKRYSSTACSTVIRTTYDVNDIVRITDPTTAVQIALIARSPLAHLRLYQPSDPEHARNLLVYPMQHVTTDVFGWKHNPSVKYDLQAALTFRRAFKRFAECYSNGALTKENIPQLHQVPRFADQAINWGSILWEFIRRYQSDHGGFRSTVDQLARSQPSRQPITIEPTSQFNNHLLEAISKVIAGDKNLSYFDEVRL